jgi:outer membrane protein assembly factor BamB
MRLTRLRLFLPALLLVALVGALSSCGGGGGGGTAPFAPGNDATYVVASDGYLHALNVSNGWDNMTPALFLPANTRATGLIIATGGDGTVAYITTRMGCGSQPDAVWAMDLASPQKTVTAFKAGGATITGTAGPALGRDGTVYVATTDGSAPLSNSVVALEPKTLKLKASVAVPKADFDSSPLVFPWKERDAVAAAGRSTLFVFDAAQLLAGPIASASVGSDAHETGALVSWLDAQSTRWFGVPSARGIATFKLVDQDGKALLQPGWTSRPIAAPLTPLVINGVLFAASSGTRSAPAVLYAIDAATGKDLWNSGRTMASSVRGGLSGGQGNVYVPGSDSTLYAFGFDIEK